MQTPVVMEFFKTMCSVERLQIAGLLLTGDGVTLRELADLLELKPAEVLDHLAEMTALNFVIAQPQTGQTLYRFNIDALHTLSRDVLRRENVTPADNVTDERERKILRNFFEGERLKILPESPVKFAILIKWLATQFEMDARYTEKQVNAIIERFHEDYATLRRGLIDAGWMRRENGVYWREVLA
jgi:hypothetical protein